MTNVTAPTPFDPRSASSDQWSRYHAFRLRRHAESRPDDPVDSDRLARADLEREHPEEVSERLLTDDGSEVSSMATLWSPRPGAASYDSNRGILWFDLYVLKDHRGRGIARSYLRGLLELAQRHEGRVVGLVAEDEDGHAAARSFGFEKKSDERYSRLDLEGLDWRMVEEWAEDGPRRSPDRRMELFTNWPPREQWPEYSRVITELFNTIPWEEEEHGDLAITPEKLAELTKLLTTTDGRVLSVVVREPDGNITALTEMALWEEQPKHAWQWLTAVHRSVQGNRIGRWIKAAMLLHIRENFPAVRWIITSNAGSNVPMLKINQELGFQAYRSTSGYQMSMADFAATVGRRAR